MSRHRLFSLIALTSAGLFSCVSLPAKADLLGYWPVELGQGDRVVNAVETGAAGEIFNPENGLGPDGSVWFNDPDRGTVLSFDGTAGGAYVLAGEIPRMTLDNDFTWAFWANQDEENTSPNDIIFGNRRNLEMQDFQPRQFIKFTPTKFEYHMNGNGNDNLEYDDLLPNEWNHHVVVKDGANLSYYRNGALASAGTISQELDVPQPLFFGGDNTGSAGENWRGLLDEIAIWDEALPAGIVAEIANGTRTPGPSILPDLPGDFNEDGAIDLADFEVIKNNFRSGTLYREGDFNFSGQIDLQDFLEFSAAFGGGAAAAVPEPSTIWLMIGAALCGLLARCRRRR